MYIIWIAGLVVAAHCNVIPDTGSEVAHKRVKRWQEAPRIETVTIAPPKFVCPGDICVPGCQDDAGRSYTPNEAQLYIVTHHSACYTCECVPPAHLGGEDISACKLTLCAPLGDCKKIVKIPDSCCSKCEDNAFEFNPTFTFPPMSFPPFPVFHDEEE